MKFSRSASYNNPHEMFPSASKLFSGMNSVAGNVTINKKDKKPGTLMKLPEEGDHIHEIGNCKLIVINQ